MWREKVGKASEADQAYHVAGLARELFRVNREECQPLVHALLKTSRGPRRLTRLHCLASVGAQADATGVCRDVSRHPVCPRSLGKETYSGFDMNESHRLTPIQSGSAAFRIAAVVISTATQELDPAVLQGWALMSALTWRSLAEDPTRASRRFDARR